MPKFATNFIVTIKNLDHIAFDTTIPLLGIYSINNFAQIFIVALVVITKTKQTGNNLNVINSKLIK